MVREFVEIPAHGPLAEVIARLETVRRQLPEGCRELGVQLRGDEIFGRHILVTFCRAETEAEIEAQRRAAEFGRKCCPRSDSSDPLE